MEQLLKEWPTIMAAPASFIGAVIACAVVLGVVIRFLYAREVAILKTHVALLQQQLGVAKEQRERLAPELDDVKATVTDLRTQIAKLPTPPAQAAAVTNLATTTSALDSRIMEVVKLSNALGYTLTPESALTRTDELIQHVQKQWRKD
jgi:phage shock protein A